PARAGAGIGNAALRPASSRLLAALTDGAARHSAFAMQRVTNNLGIGLGGLAGGLIATTEHPTSYTVLFLVDAATFVACLATLAFVPSPPQLERGSARGPGGYPTAVRGAFLADLADPALLGRYLALAAVSFQLGYSAGRAGGGFLLAASPLGLWLVGAGMCVAGGVGALALERRIPQEIRRTPRRVPLVEAA